MLFALKFDEVSFFSYPSTTYLCSTQIRSSLMDLSGLEGQILVSLALMVVLTSYI
jgi:hypothetical protein